MDIKKIHICQIQNNVHIFSRNTTKKSKNKENKFLTLYTCSINGLKIKETILMSFHIQIM